MISVFRNGPEVGRAWAELGEQKKSDVTLIISHGARSACTGVPTTSLGRD